MIDTVSVLQRVNLAQLITRDTEAAKGSRVWCPMCQPGGSSKNNSPAMSIRGDHFRCFGCGASGDAIDYVMLREKVDFQEACKRLGWDGTEPNSVELERLQAERKQQAAAQVAARAMELDALLAEYSAEEIWAAYNRRLTHEHRRWWTGRGVPEDWQDYLMLGFIPDKTYRGKDKQLYHSPAYTIPYFHTGRKFQTIQYRLHNPNRPQDRYRFEYGLKSTYYQVDPGQPVREWAIICEGAIKAMVVHIVGGTGDDVTILGIPSKVDFGGVVDVVKQCKRVWICLDPDCWDKPANTGNDWQPSPIEMARQIGKAARVVRMPGKIDDLFQQSGLTANTWKSALKNARAL